MKRQFRRWLRAKDGDPSPLAWSLASISLVLPVLGLGLCLVGGARLLRGTDGGWMLVALGIAAIGSDFLMDFMWARPEISASDQPDLNRRGEQLVGRTAIVVDAIEAGRGKVRIGDTVWPAEGPDAGAGQAVSVIAARESVLVVELMPRS